MHPHPFRGSRPVLEGKHVLVLEDEPIVAFMVEDMLVELGARKVIATSRVTEAIAVLAFEKVDAAVLDVNVHGQESYGVADRLTELSVPYIFATGYGDRRIRSGIGPLRR